VSSKSVGPAVLEFLNDLVLFTLALDETSLAKEPYLFDALPDAGLPN